MGGITTTNNKYVLQYDERKAQTLSPDSEGGPVVMFAPTNGETLIIVKGYATIDEDMSTVRKGKQPTMLRYSVDEWDAFIRAVYEGEFDDLLEGSDSDMIPIRDSKNPTGPKLVYQAGQIRQFFSGVRQGKYDIPSTA
jgi:hypothetical protein